MINRRVSIGEQIFYVVNYVILALFAFVTIFPLLHILALSLSSSNEIISRNVFLLPKGFTTESYRNIINDGRIILGLKNTVVITVVGTFLNMAATIMCAYPLSKKRLAGRGIFMGLIVFTMLFSGGLIPSFILVKFFGIMDSYWALWLPGLISVYNMIVLRTFFMGIPESLEEAAQIDGANDIYILVRIILPLSLPGIATLSLFYAVGWWNEYFSNMIYITSTGKASMALILMQMVQTVSDSMMQSGEGALAQQKRIVAESVKAASFVVAVVPILCVYPFLQKYFVKGVMIGSIKG